MHTFFINTSSEELKNCEELLEIQRETRQLVSLSCPLTRWMDKETGYRRCVREIGEIIDNYREVNNDYNLLIYVDLIAFTQYSSISRNNGMEREACLKAMYALLKHYIDQTLVNLLEENARMPIEITVIFEEDDRLRDTADQKELCGKMCQFMGIPDPEPFDDPKDFLDAITNGHVEGIVPDLISTFQEEIKILSEEIEGGKTIGDALSEMADNIIRESHDSIKQVSFITSRRAGSTNKRENCKQVLQLAMYIYSCVFSERLWEKDAQNGGEKIARKFQDLKTEQWVKIWLYFAQKKTIFRETLRKINAETADFSKLKLAPTLKKLDHSKFLLDENGSKMRGSTIDRTDVKIEYGEEGNPVQRAGHIISDRAEDPKNLFSEKEYSPFEYDIENEAGEHTGVPSSAEVEGTIERFRQDNLNFVRKIKRHIREKLSNYGGRSDTNKKELLEKRVVSPTRDKSDNQFSKYNYADRDVENGVIETVKDVSEKAYKTAEIEYLKALGGGDVSIQDIKEACERLSAALEEINKCRKNLNRILIGLIVGMVLLYIPYLIIQWKAITENTLSIIVAIVSFCIPLAISLGVFVFLSIKLRKAHVKVWNDFLIKVKDSRSNNMRAVKTRDELLYFYIPSLRWIYEYKLDVSFYENCCRMAMAKLKHHRSMISRKIEVIDSILENMEMQWTDKQYGGSPIPAEADYNLSYSSGNMNQMFYSLIGSELIDYLKQKK